MRRRRVARVALGLAAAACAALALALLARAPGEPQRVAAGVHLEEADVSGLSADEVRTLLASLAPGLRVAPIEPRVDPDTRGLVPGLDGLELDVEATLDALLHAAPGETVAYRMRAVPPRKTLADLPLGAVYRGNPAKPAFAILINVAWGDEWIPELLRVLDDHGAKATWFLMGDWARRSPGLAREIAARGHEIASHGDSAVEWGALDRAAMLRQVSDADAAIERATGVRPFWFSTHKGVVSPEILRVARELGHETVMWTVDTVDWMNPPVDWMVERVLARAGPGALVLMHPTPRTPAALDRILSGLGARGLRPLTLSELLSPRRLPPAAAARPAPAPSAARSPSPP
ncbi:MAG: polysaccharide deacetylase family protein [Clostridia bacterium]|nr:polysaccharide deacetylase family protein [Clostridia bacterium]